MHLHPHYQIICIQIILLVLFEVADFLKTVFLFQLKTTAVSPIKLFNLKLYHKKVFII